MFELIVGMVVGICIGTYFDCSFLTELLMKHVRPLLKLRDKSDGVQNGVA